MLFLLDLEIKTANSSSSLNNMKVNMKDRPVHQLDSPLAAEVNDAVPPRTESLPFSSHELQ